MNLIPVQNPDFDREQWTTCHITRLTPGDVLSFKGPLRPAVVVSNTIDTTAGDEHGKASGTVLFLDNQETEDFELRGNTSVVVRCDLRYETAA
jgi:hypothetical protein